MSLVLEEGRIDFVVYFNHKVRVFDQEFARKLRINKAVSQSIYLRIEALKRSHLR